MAWKETPRAAAAPVRKTYRCTDCGHEFRWIHTPEEQDVPECPLCPAETAASASPRVEWKPPLVGIGTAKGRAIDYTQAMAETQFGLTDMNDNQRVGDTAFKAPAPLHTGERERQTRELVEAGIREQTAQQIIDAPQNFWQGGMGAPSTEATLGQHAVAKQASDAARSQGADPVSVIEGHRQATGGGVGRGFQVAAAVSADIV